jgi:hypothetical protein
MSMLRKSVLLGTLLAGMVYAVMAYAYPMPGDDEEVYVIYYADTARTIQVGQRGISHGDACTAWHATWGSVTSNTRVFVEKCYTSGGIFD